MLTLMPSLSTASIMTFLLNDVVLKHCLHYVCLCCKKRGSPNEPTVGSGRRRVYGYCAAVGSLQRVPDRRAHRRPRCSTQKSGGTQAGGSLTRHRLPGPRPNRRSARDSKPQPRDAHPRPEPRAARKRGAQRPETGSHGLLLQRRETRASAQGNSEGGARRDLVRAEIDRRPDGGVVWRSGEIGGQERSLSVDGPRK